MPLGSRRLVRGIGLVALALLTSGCVKASVSLNVRSDDQVDGSIVMAVDRTYVPPGGQAPDALLDQVTQRVFHGTATGSHQEPYADPQYVGRRVTIEGMSLLDFNRGTSSGGLKIVHQGSEFRLSGTVDTVDLAAAAGASSAASADRIARTFDVVIQVTFPGPVTQSNGTVSGDTVTWRPRFGQRLALSAVAADGPGPPGWLLPALVLVAATAVGGVVVWRVRPHRSRAGRAA
jgi:hypothetical protein